MIHAFFSPNSLFSPSEAVTLYETLQETLTMKITMETSSLTVYKENLQPRRHKELQHSTKCFNYYKLLTTIVFLKHEN